ncbi:ATP/GTP-binding protein [Gracilibacillus boraciitolerans JCM 21714]|uniref:Putative pyruvate, phosphate dikinase regulatory protein n=1 Tax=Gracilibacillus boraciitolerans JCM 21714 TaxID=1298598 RepID=W4VEC7_9BACI|nr:pyruvate, water dikinase regulatory protein [Gracilibacillus boraciitolerans]GAE91168.1 ATP/GTP-binding protein [Gracilibacillus boraciitolerans JCM 21714]
MEKAIIYVVSDSVGETAEFVIKAALSQFMNEKEYDLYRISYVENLEVLRGAVYHAQQLGAMIGFTLVNPEYSQFLKYESADKHVECVDIMGPMLQAMERKFGRKPKEEPGLIHKLDEDYFRRIEAIEFAVRYDDGRDPRGVLQADIVLIGVSRTSKTPLSQYLAHKQLKVANVPIVPEVEPPSTLFEIPTNKCIGLKISSEKLNGIRRERLKSLGLADHAIYANMERIETELAFFDDLILQLGCPVIDVSHKAVEETANIIMQMINQPYWNLDRIDHKHE